MKKNLCESGKCGAKHEGYGKRYCSQWKHDVTGLYHCDWYLMSGGLCLCREAKNDN